MGDVRCKPIINRSTNPSFEASTGGATVTNSTRTRVNTPAPLYGSWFQRQTRTGSDATAGTQAFRFAGVNILTVAGSAGTRMRRTVYVRPSTTRNCAVTSGAAPSAGVAVPCAANTWTRLAEVAVNSSGGNLYIYSDGMVVGETLDTDGMMALYGPHSYINHAFADGGSNGWKWLGTAHASESVGYTRGWTN